MSLIRRAIAAPERRAAGEWGDSTPPPPGGMGTPSGVVITEATALQSLAVYGSVGVISDAVATLPIQLFSSLDPAKRRELAPSPLITRPYAEISRIDWFVQAVMSLALRGNFFGHIIERDENLYAAQIKPIHPDRASVVRRSDGTLEYRFNGRRVPIDDVFHVRYLSVAGALCGLNPIEYLRVTLGLDRAADLYGASWFGNSAFPAGVLTTEEDLDDEETLALVRSWIAAHGGLGKANLPAVLTGGVKFDAISINPRDSQFLESREFSQSAISGMIFRVPPHMLGLVDKTTSWGTGIAQQEQGFVTNTLGGYISRLEEALTTVHPPRQYVKFNVDGRLRGDKLQRYQAYALGTAGGWLCADDVLAAEDMPPIPDGKGQNYMVPINSELLEQALQSIKDQQATDAQAQLQGGGANA